MKFNIDIAMRNSYNVIVDNISLNDFKDCTTSYFIHNPSVEVTKETLLDMYRYFKSKKEWDKVVKITKLIAKIKFYDTTKRLSRVYSK